MRSKLRSIRIIAVAVVIPVVGLILIVYYVNNVISALSDDTAKGTVLAAAVTLYGVIFSAAYNEVSSYYKAANASLNQKWKLIFPLVQNHYIPWINVSKVLEGSLRLAIGSSSLDVDAVNLVHFNLMLFHGYRFRFILQAGGLILLSTPEDDKQVEDAYRSLETKLLWAGDEVQTRLKASYLSHIFVTKNIPNLPATTKPYVFDDFKAEMASNKDLRDMQESLKKWLNDKKKVAQACDALLFFRTSFKDNIDKLYSSW